MTVQVAPKTAPARAAAVDETAPSRGRAFEATLLAVRVLVALAMFALAASLLLLTRELASWRAEVPDALAQSSDWQLQVAGVRQQVETLQPKIDSALQLGDRAVTETERVRREVFPVLREANEVNGTVRAALSRIDATLERVDGIEKQLPGIVKTVQAAVAEVKRTNDAIPEVLQEVRNSRSDAQHMLDQAEHVVEEGEQEIRDTRADVHQMLDQAGDVIKDSEAAGAEGAVKGFVTGVLKLPISPITGIRDRHKDKAADHGTKPLADAYAEKLSGSDHGRIRKATDQALAGQVGKAYTWKNRRSGHSGAVTAQRAYTNDEGPCRDLRFDLTLEDGEQHHTNLSICHDGKQWQVVAFP